MALVVGAAGMSTRFEYVMLKYVVSRYIRKGLVLDYVSVEEPFQATVQWEHATKMASG